MKNGANVNANIAGDGSTPLHFAMLPGIRTEKAMVALLLTNKADLNVTNENGRTPLHYAATQKSYRLEVELLLAGKADVNAKDKEAQDPFKPGIA